MSARYLLDTNICICIAKQNPVEPELGDAVFTLHVDMLGLISITGVEEKPIRSDTQDSGHSDYPRDAMRLTTKINLARSASAVCFR